jgi:HrpA-like RNA helicase
MSQILVPGWQNNGDFIDNNGKTYLRESALNALAKTKELPAYAYRKTFNQALSDGSKVIIVQGATGS